MQSLSETRINFVNATWSLASKLENDALKRSSDHMQFLSSEIPRNDPSLDSMMFVRHNVSAWQEPSDMGFEASPVWHDDSAMVVNEAAKIFLRNILGKSKSQRNELRRELDQKRRDVEKARTIRQSIREGRDKRDEVEVSRAIFGLQEELHEAERKWLTAEVETLTITSVVGDISIGAQNHNFKSQTFKIPTNCDLCGERIWGLSAKGFDCRDCGYTCHSKCELKVPADCPGEQSKDERKRLKNERQASANIVLPQTNGEPPEGVAELSDLARSNTMNSLSSGYATSAHRSVSGKITSSESVQDTGSGVSSTKLSASRKHRIVAPPPAAFVHEAPTDTPNGSSTRMGNIRGRMLYAYQASGEGEVTVEEGTDVTIVEPDGTHFSPICFLSLIPNCLCPTKIRYSTS